MLDKSNQIIKEDNEIILARHQKLKKLIELGVNPYHKSIPFSDTFKTLYKKYHHLSKEDLINRKIKSSSVGRIVSMRGPFINLKSEFETLQIYISKDNQKVQTIYKLLDLGDIVWVEGLVMKTTIGKLAINVNEIKVLAKSLLPLPEKWHGLKDVEERYRHRYVDLLVNDKIKELFWTRTKMISLIREFFDTQGYMEVETPILQSILGGASARPFKTYHNTLERKFNLRIATELPLKKLLVGGIERVYEIGRIFRNEGIDTTHNPEFSSIEFYQAYSNLDQMIKQTENLLVFLAKKLNKNQLTFKNHQIIIKPPFKKISMLEIVNQKTKQDFSKLSLQEAKQIANKYKIKVLPYFQVGHIVNELFELLVEPHLIEPTFVIGYPIEISPLAAKNDLNPKYTDRCELFIGTKEFANMFTELNDPIEQLKRFEEQLKERNAGNDEANEIDEDFIKALEYGMPPAGGCGIGIDRLAMLFTNSDSIREVLLFPHLRQKGE